jgi:1-acyl-sn-glycerol-3-phosphate acyltransferase
MYDTSPLPPFRDKMLRQLRRAAGAGSVAAVAYSYWDEEWRRSLSIAIVGSACRLFIRAPNNFTLHDAHHMEHSLRRPAGTALLSVSNHIATVDDPHLLSSIVPYTTLLRAREMRWGVCADDVCFRPGTNLCRLADLAKVLPIRRGAGVWQQELDTLIGKLRAGEWVHYFPEGKIRQDGRVHPFRRGVGRLAACVQEPARLIVLPFYHTGCDQLQPTTPTSTSVLSRPNFGSDIHVIFGPPVDLSRLLALRGTPPFDRRPELLFEVIAHTLEEEVRALREKLHRKLGVTPQISREGGCFDVDGAVLHPDAVRATTRVVRPAVLDATGTTASSSTMTIASADCKVISKSGGT